MSTTATPASSTRCGGLLIGAEYASVEVILTHIANNHLHEHHEDALPHARFGHSLLQQKVPIIIRLSGQPVLADAVEARLATGYQLHPRKRLNSIVNDRESIFFSINGRRSCVPPALLQSPPHAEHPASTPLTTVVASSRPHPPAPPKGPRLPAALDTSTVETLIATAATEADNGNVAGALALCCTVQTRVHTHHPCC